MSKLAPWANAIAVDPQRIRVFLDFRAIVYVSHRIFRCLSLLQVAQKPREDGAARIGMVRVAARSLDQAHVLTRAQVVVDLLCTRKRFADGADVEDAVAVGGANEHGARRDQARHVGQFPAVGVYEEHAVAVAVHRALADV